MSRFEREWAIVPTGARWTAALVCLAFASFLGLVLLLPGLAEKEGTPFLVRLPIFLASLVGVALVGAYVLLVGYVCGDARRRGMNSVLWTLLAIFIPNAIGIILFFILREPVPVPCPSCGTPAKKGHAYCAVCGAAVRAACPQCHQPVEPGAHNCTRCGAPLASTSSPPALS
jgi:hypothetical protein